MNNTFPFNWQKLDNSNVKNVITDLKTFLHKNHFPLFYRQSILEGYQVIPFPTRRNVQPPTELIHTLERLFFRGGKVAKRKFLQFFDKLGSDLLSSGILGEKNETPAVVYSHFRIVYDRNILLFLPYKKYLSNNVYLGADSLSLARNLFFSEKMMKPELSNLRSLDLFSGTGIQTFHLKEQVNIKTSVGVDLLSDAIHCAQLNAITNGYEDTTYFFEGNLSLSDTYDILKRQFHSFDIIIANPPILPEPSWKKHRLYTYGGSDGLNLIRKIIPEISQLLNKDGIANILLCSLGSASEPTFLSELSSYLDINRVSYRVIIIKKIPIELDAYYRTAHKPEEYRKWIDFYQQQSASYWYRMILYIADNPSYFDNKCLNFARSSFEKPIPKVSMQEIKSKTYFHCSISNLKKIWDFIERTFNKQQSHISTKEFAQLLFDQFPKEFINLGYTMHFVGLLFEREQKSPYLERFTW